MHKINRKFSVINLKLGNMFSDDTFSDDTFSDDSTGCFIRFLMIPLDASYVF